MLSFLPFILVLLFLIICQLLLQNLRTVPYDSFSYKSVPYKVILNVFMGYCNRKLLIKVFIRSESRHTFIDRMREIRFLSWDMSINLDGFLCRKFFFVKSAKNCEVICKSQFGDFLNDIKWKVIFFCWVSFFTTNSDIIKATLEGIHFSIIQN